MLHEVFRRGDCGSILWQLEEYKFPNLSPTRDASSFVRSLHSAFQT